MDLCYGVLARRFELGVTYAEGRAFARVQAGRGAGGAAMFESAKAMLSLRYDTPAQWAQIALSELDQFLRDHANNERRVSGSALLIATHYPERTQLVRTMIELAREELEHFQAVHELLVARGQCLGQDERDPYTHELWQKLRRRNRDEFLLDRLVLFAIVEARGCERFSMLAKVLETGEAELARFYTGLAASEARHHTTYLRLAHELFAHERVQSRLDELLDSEAEVVAGLPLRPALH